MPYIANIVDIINTSIAAKLSDGIRFVNQLNGLSELIPRRDEDSTTIPVLVTTVDNRKYDGLDERYSVQLYHRVLNTETIESQLSYGDGNKNGRDKTTMRLVCFADKQRTKLDQYQMSFILRSLLNEQYIGQSIALLNGLLCAMTESKDDNHNSVDVWTNEYSLPQDSYPIKLHQTLFSIDYSITTDYNIRCITNCLEC